MAIEFYDSLNVDSNDDSYFLGDVGIGTTSPSEKLEVAGNIQISDADGYLQFKDTNASSENGIRRIYNADQNLYFSRRNDDGSLQSNDMLINSTGNVGIGTTSPSNKLSVLGSSGFQFEIINSINSKSWRPNVNGNDFYITESGVGNPFMIKAGGNVGIGTTSPSAKLEVNGGFRAGGGGGANSEFEVEGGGDIITRAPLKCEDDIELNAGLADETGSPGSNNYILKSTGSAVRWITFPGVTSTTTGEPSGSSTVSNIVEIDQADYNTAAGNGTLVAGTVYLIT